MKSYIMTRNLVHSVSAIAVMVLASTVFAQTTLTTEDGNGADAHVWKGAHGNSNYGSSTDVHAQDYTDSSSNLGYIRFDISGISGTLGNVTLKLVSLSGPAAVGKPFYIWGLKDSQNADNWGESTITYNNAPGLDGTVTGGDGERATQDVDLSKADRLDDVTLLQVAAGSTVSFSNENLLNFLNEDTDGLITLIIGAPKVSSDPAFLWASKEHATYIAPTLELTLVGILLSASTVASNAPPGTRVGNLSFADADAFTVDQTQGDYGWFEITGSTNLRTTAWMTTNALDVSIIATSNGTALATNSFPITSTAPFTFSFVADAEVQANSADGTTVGTAATVDPDAQFSILYGGREDLFYMDGAALKLTNPNDWGGSGTTNYVTLRATANGKTNQLVVAVSVISGTAQGSIFRFR